MGGPEPDHRVQVQPEPDGIDHGAVAGDDAELLQTPDPGGDRRLREVDQPPDLGDAHASLALQDRQDRAVGGVQ